MNIFAQFGWAGFVVLGVIFILREAKGFQQKKNGNGDLSAVLARQTAILENIQGQMGQMAEGINKLVTIQEFLRNR